MQTLKEIEQLSVKLNDAYNSSGIINALEEFLPSVNIFIYDSTSETLRNFSKSWISIDEFLEKDKSKKLYSIFEKLKSEKYYLENEELYYPLFRGQKLIGMMEFLKKLDDKAMEFMNYLILLQLLMKSKKAKVTLIYIYLLLKNLMLILANVWYLKIS